MPGTDGTLCYLAPSMFQDSKVINIIVSLHYLLHLALLMIYILFWICLPFLFPRISIVYNIRRNVIINFFLTLLISKHPWPAINLESYYILEYIFSHTCILGTLGKPLTFILLFPSPYYEYVIALAPYSHLENQLCFVFILLDTMSPILNLLPP